MREMFVMNEPESYCAPSEGGLLKARRWVERGGGWAGWSTLDLHTSAHCFYLASQCLLNIHTPQQENCIPLICNYKCTADFENAGDYYFFAGKLLYGPFRGIF
jgi:hypothetical protein